MSTLPSHVPAPTDWVASIGDLCLPPRANRRLTELLDRNNNGSLAAHERDELESLVEVSETLTMVRARALQLLGRRPA